MKTRCLLLAVAVVAAVLLSGQAGKHPIPPPPTWQKRVTFWDKAKVWQHDLDGPLGLAMRDGKDRERAALELAKDGTPYLVFKDEQGRIRVRLDLAKDGSARRFFDEKGAVAWKTPLR